MTHPNLVQLIHEYIVISYFVNAQVGGLALLTPLLHVIQISSIT